ncbi:hypothetical protein [Aureimonas sp. ME7]|uniref:hypothetical protein n=1 Tax=Aureimonas sp. ME7 TaxID=2744252 RepID=UPI0015F54452|nr:hypothetical protein [Aureimonas sp. ME7]
MKRLHTHPNRLVRAIIIAQYVALELGSPSVNNLLNAALIAAEASEADRTPNPAA